MIKRLVQLHNGTNRLVASVEEPKLRLVGGFASIYAIVRAAIESKERLRDVVREHLSDETLDYDAIYQGKSSWILLSPIDHPDESSRCLVSGTGLTHLGSAKDRTAMHQMPNEQMTDSMRMFRSGLDGGKPAAGQIGTSPEWFYKGSGNILRSPNSPLEVPAFAMDGGEEAEIVGVYIIGSDSRAYRVGMCQGNEFSDHKFEKINYLNLAASKLRNCSIGPELVIDPEFQSIPGTVTIERSGAVVWSKSISSGEKEMSHSLANLEHHHFKHESHRRPGDVHVHYYGAHSLSFGEGVTLMDGDVMSVQFEGFGRALRNPLKMAGMKEKLVDVAAMT